MAGELIQEVSINNGTHHKIASTAYAVCSTNASVAAKTIEVTGFTLITGTTIHVKFINENTAADPTLNIYYDSTNSVGAKPIVQYGTEAVGTTNNTTGWLAGAVLSLTYDGTSWVRD